MRLRRIYFILIIGFAMGGIPLRSQAISSPNAVQVPATPNETPILRPFAAVPTAPSRITMYNDVLYVLSLYHIQAFDMSDPEHPLLLGSIYHEALVNASQLVVIDHYALITWGHIGNDMISKYGGIEVIDIAIPQQMRHITMYSVPIPSIVGIVDDQIIFRRENSEIYQISLQNLLNNEPATKIYQSFWGDIGLIGDDLFINVCDPNCDLEFYRFNHASKIFEFVGYYPYIYGPSWKRKQFTRSGDRLYTYAYRSSNIQGTEYIKQLEVFDISQIMTPTLITTRTVDDSQQLAVLNA